MVHSLFLFPTDADVAAIDRFLSEVAVPALIARPGTRALYVSEGPLLGPGGPKPYSKVVEIHHEDLHEMNALARSEEGPRIADSVLAHGGTIAGYEAVTHRDAPGGA